MELRLLTVQPADKLLYPLSPVIYSRAAQCIEQDIELIRTILGLFFWGFFFYICFCVSMPETGNLLLAERDNMSFLWLHFVSAAPKWQNSYCKSQ